MKEWRKVEKLSLRLLISTSIKQLLVRKMPYLPNSGISLICRGGSPTRERYYYCKWCRICIEPVQLACQILKQGYDVWWRQVFYPKSTECQGFAGCVRMASTVGVDDEHVGIINALKRLKFDDIADAPEIVVHSYMEVGLEKSTWNISHHDETR